MKIIFGTIASVLVAMGTYLVIIALITLRVYHLSITQNLEVREGYAEANSYFAYALAFFCIAGAISIVSRDVD